MVQKKFKGRPQNKIFTPLRSSFQNFLREAPSCLYGSPPGTEDDLKSRAPTQIYRSRFEHVYVPENHDYLSWS